LPHRGETVDDVSPPGYTGKRFAQKKGGVMPRLPNKGTTGCYAEETGGESTKGRKKKEYRLVIWSCAKKEGRLRTMLKSMTLRGIELSMKGRGRASM